VREIERKETAKSRAREKQRLGERARAHGIV
jgi:hypothetical protein